MKVLSFNVGIWSRNWKKSDPFFWKDRMRLMKDLLSAEQPDVICFQELWFPATLYIPRGYRKVCGSGLEHPIYVRKGLKARLGKFRIHWSAAEINGVKIVSTHGHWNEDITIKLCKDLEGYVRPGEKALLVGDWNVTPDDLFKHLDKRFTNVREYMGLPSEDTYIHFHDHTRRGELDFFVSQNIDKMSDYRIIPSPEQLRISDHHPISIDIN